MSSWNKVKSLFIVREEEPTPTGRAGELDVDEALARYEVPPGPGAALPPQTDPAQLKGTIDFQALYDQAGIPNTDEVEALEKFLGGLDADLPQPSKLAAARAFLNAIGKSPDHVLADAGKKIDVVRAVRDATGADADGRVAELQKAIDDLQKQIEQCRASMEQIKRELEHSRSQCAVEEARLQGARVFFGHVGGVAKPSGTGG
jgi:hypothetical protein